MRQMFVRICIAVLICLGSIGLPQSAMAQDPCAVSGLRTDIRPDPAGVTTRISVGMYVVDILEIDDVNQTITLDIAARLSWRDPRLAHWAGCKVPIASIWFPELVLRNSGRMFSRWPETASIEEGGEVLYLQRFSGTFSSYHSLNLFPFDQQEIMLRFFPLDWSLAKVELVADDRFSLLSPILNISDWKILGMDTRTGELEVESMGQTHTNFDLVITAERHTGYYVLKIMLPIALIVSMSWLVFWIDASEFGTQLGLSATAVLTMIAFIFATTNMLPRLGYFTMLDRYVAGATVFVFAALLQSLITGYLASQGHRYAARRIDLLSRYAFPAAFVLSCLRFLRSVI